MNDNLPLEDLHSSLKSLSVLRSSAFVSISLMTIGVAVIVAAFVYSVTRLQPLEKQIEGKRQELSTLEKQKDEKQKDLDATMQELNRRKDELLTFKLEADAKVSIKDQPKPGQPPVGQIKEGFAYYGILNENGSWEARYFSNDSREKKTVPQVGDSITSISAINLRAGYIEYDTVKGWINKPPIGVIRPSQHFKVLEVNRIADDYVWVKLQSS